MLWNQYQTTGDQKFLEEFKKYCKNDVRMTALVMFYFLHFKKIFVEGEEFVFTTEEFVQKSNHLQEEIATEEIQNQSIF